jgi:hypothetical protein
MSIYPSFYKEIINSRVFIALDEFLEAEEVVDSVVGVGF